MDEAIIEDTIQEVISCSTFVLDTAFEGIEKMKEKLPQLEQDIKDGPDVNQDKIQLYNFMAYLYWRLEKRSEALAATEQAEKLAEAPNLITRCNKIVFCRESGEYSQSKQLSDSLQNDQFKQKAVRIQADAEIAYYYSRLGPKHHEKAVKAFRKAIKDISPERNISWEYALAQTLRRQSNMFQMLKTENFNPDRNQEEAASLLYGVIRFSSDGYRQTKAKAWCELSKILMHFDNLYDIIKTQDTEDEKIDETRCFEEALKLCPKEYFVLYSYGRHLRYRNELKKSKEMLERAICVRDECSSRHHLALTLQKMVVIENAKPANEKELQSSSSKEERQQLIQDPHHSGSDVICRRIPSLSVHSKPNEYHPSDSKNQKHTFSSKRKSPRFVCISPNNPLLLEAVDHLKMALKMKTGFDVARHDLGLIYRMLGQPEEALKCFTGITSNMRGKPSEYPLTLINAYEQQAICKLEMIEKESDTKKIQAMKYDAWAAMWKTVTLVSGVIRALPMLRTTTECFPIMKMLLQNDEKSTDLEILKGLAKLNELLMFNEESLKFYEQISELDEDPKYTKKIIENCLKLGNFEKAICLLSYLERTKKKDVFDKAFYVNTYSNGAKEALFKGDFEMAKIRFCKAYQTIMSHLIDLTERKGDNSKNPLDILVLDSCDESENCCWIERISFILKLFLNLNVAVNHRDCLPNRYTHEYLESTMEDARCIFIVQHELKIENKDTSIEYALNVLAKKYFKKIILFRVGDCGQSSSGFKEFSLPMDAEIANDKVKQGVLLSDVLFKIADLFSENC